VVTSVSLLNNPIPKKVFNKRRKKLNNIGSWPFLPLKTFRGPKSFKTEIEVTIIRVTDDCRLVSAETILIPFYKEGLKKLASRVSKICTRRRTANTYVNIRIVIYRPP
jgi:rubrerythrin